MNWEDKTEVKKGNIGERLVDEWLIKNDIVPYVPSKMWGCEHPFDRLCATKDKRGVFIADAKTKEMRIHYPDTGFDIRHYNQYKYIENKYKINIFIFFIDKNDGKIYGNWLYELEVKRDIFHKNKQLIYPLRHNGIIYFPREAMKDICELPKEEIIQLEKYTTINGKYKR